jgi:hypothetical protein
MSHEAAAADWYGLYHGNTSRDDLLFVPESTVHPAKMSIPLALRIFEEMVALGWLQHGQCVVDPFGGRGTTAALWCSRHPDNRAVTVEVEAHFVALQRANKAHAERLLGRPFRWTILEGDSRHADVLLASAWADAGWTGREQVAAGVLSPPYEAQSGGSGPISRKSLPDPAVLDRCGYRTDANGTAAPQIGMEQGEDYAQACRAVYAALARAGVRYLAVVTKDPTRAGKLHPLGEMTCRLLEQAGYVVRHHRKAWLWETEAQRDERQGQSSLFGETVPESARATGRLSFFARLHLKKGAPRAQWEDIYFCELVQHGRGQNLSLAIQEDRGTGVEESSDCSHVSAMAVDALIVPPSIRYGGNPKSESLIQASDETMNDSIGAAEGKHSSEATGSGNAWGAVQRA